MKKITMKVCLMAVAMLMLSGLQQKAVAQEFMSKYATITDKNFAKFMSDWVAWSAKEAEAAKAESMNVLTNQVVEDLSKGSGYVQRYNENSKYTVFQCDLSITKHEKELGNRKPQTDKYKSDAIEEKSIRPYAETGKPILYINNLIAMALMEYLEKDNSGKRMAQIKEYFNVVPDGGGYHFCSVPYVAHFDIFADCVVVDCREGWGNGTWVRYNVGYKKADVVSEWMR